MFVSLLQRGLTVRKCRDSFLHLYGVAVCFVIEIIKANVDTAKIVMPTYTCGSLRMGKAKQNMAQFNAFVMMAIVLVNLEPFLSIATKFNKPAKMIAMPAPTNQSVLVFIYRGKAKLICSIPKRMMMYDTILMRLSTTRFVHLYWWAGCRTIATKYAAISLLRF